MRTTEPVAIRRADYAPLPWRVAHAHLRFELDPGATRVSARLRIERVVPDGDAGGDAATGTGPIELDGVGIELESIRIDGEPLEPSAYTLEPERLVLHAPPARFELETVGVVDPDANTALEGLYRSSGTFCTQCEAEGFRKITWYPDRPDVLATFDVVIEADEALAPVLLSNGNLVSDESLPDGRRRAHWHDPHPKPSYLFALVAGDLVEVSDAFRTMSGKDVRLSIFVEAHNAERCAFAMESLKHSMAWDERVYGLEYDLERFMIVAVDDFNMGAMENKGLNVFNSKFVLADVETATDTDFLWVEAVIAHEYFHNWTGNRVTCRDWFQLSLKEGLTVFRDQSFTADRHSATVKRIDDVRRLRAHQFPEDAGPLAHPVRPESYIEINNFYTTTVYEKGAEVVRMIHSLVGPEAFRRGIELYFERHDGTAATCEDFVLAMEGASGADLAQFRLWYSLAGTPELACEERWDERAGRWTLDVRQRCPDTPGQDDKPPMHVPFAFGLLGPDGAEIPIAPVDGPGGGGTDDDAGAFRVARDVATGPYDAAATGGAPHARPFALREREHRITVDGLDARPVASLLRGFSAPVRLVRDVDVDALGFLAAHDTDGFNRWEAGQRLARLAIDAWLDGDAGAGDAAADRFVDVVGALLADVDGDPALRAEALAPPALMAIAEERSRIDVGAVDASRRALLVRIAEAHRDALEALVRAPTSDAGFGGRASGERALANAALGLLSALDESVWVPLACARHDGARTMTDRLAALALLCHAEDGARTSRLEDFRTRFAGNALVLDKWFAMQAASRRADTLERVVALSGHPDFDASNPNRLRALIATFAQANPLRFHAPGGGGYRLLSDRVVALDRTNPQVAARLAGAFGRWRRFVEPQSELMRAELERIRDAGPRSPDVQEIVLRSLEG